MIVIAGAGIGGLTLGCALTLTRRPFRIVERAAELRPIGAGIALSPNAFRALAYIRLESAVRTIGHPLDFGAICDPSGQVLIGARVGDVAAGSVALARADLQMALLAALKVDVHLGRPVVGYENTSNGVRVHLSTGETIDAELLVGADGLHSTVRLLMRGDEPLRYSGQTTWRGLVDSVTGIDTERFTETWGAQQRFGIVPLSRSRVYWFAVAEAPRGGNDVGDPRPQLQTRFHGWHKPIEAILASTPQNSVLRTDILDRPPIHQWVDRRVALLGDAAHPMTPDGGMGGCQAIEDAVVLADALRREANIEAALARYQSRRVSRANHFVRQSHRMGQLAHLGPAPLRWLRNRVLRAVPSRLVAYAMTRDFEFRL
jgi:2-polyprenyl-6-methoxyphenol hydroxylase-like FAD-dependent oxidoreductase